MVTPFISERDTDHQAKSAIPCVDFSTMSFSIDCSLDRVCDSKIDKIMPVERMVIIEGACGSGKTYAIKTWCNKNNVEYILVHEEIPTDIIEDTFRLGSCDISSFLTQNESAKKAKCFVFDALDQWGSSGSGIKSIFLRFSKLWVNEMLPTKKPRKFKPPSHIQGYSCFLDFLQKLNLYVVFTCESSYERSCQEFISEFIRNAQQVTKKGIQKSPPYAVFRKFITIERCKTVSYLFSKKLTILLIDKLTSENQLTLTRENITKFVEEHVLHVFANEKGTPRGAIFMDIRQYLIELSESFRVYLYKKLVLMEKTNTTDHSIRTFDILLSNGFKMRNIFDILKYMLIDFPRFCTNSRQNAYEQYADLYQYFVSTQPVFESRLVSNVYQSLSHYFKIADTEKDDVFKKELLLLQQSFSDSLSVSYSSECYEQRERQFAGRLLNILCYLYDCPHKHPSIYASTPRFNASYTKNTGSKYTVGLYKMYHFSMVDWESLAHIYSSYNISSKLMMKKDPTNIPAVFCIDDYVEQRMISIREEIPREKDKKDLHKQQKKKVWYFTEQEKAKEILSTALHQYWKFGEMVNKNIWTKSKP
jgi:hypothetical protein